MGTGTWSLRDTDKTDKDAHITCQAAAVSGSHSPTPAPAQHPRCQDGHPHPHSTFAKKWEQRFPTFTVDKYQLRRQSQNVPQPGRPSDNSVLLEGSQ